MSYVNNIEADVMSVVSVIPDPLHGNHRRHRVHDMVFSAIVSVMCGFSSYRMFETFVALNLAWFRSHGCPFENGVPDANTFQYLFAHLDPGLLAACLRSVAAKLRERLPFEIVSFDGKAATLVPQCASVQACKRATCGGECQCQCRVRRDLRRRNWR